MDIFAQLKSDHDQVKALFRKLEGAAASGRRTLFEQVKVALIAHSKAEDQTFYSELETDEELEEKIIDAREEHEAIDYLIDQLAAGDPAGDKWLATFQELVRAVEHHVQAEEDEIFPLASQILDNEDAEVLGNSMRSLGESLKPQPGA